MEDKILSFIESNSDEFVALLKELIRIPSLTGEEGKAQLFIESFLKKLGLDVEMWEPDIEQIFRTFPDVAQYPTHWQHDLILPYDDLPTYEMLLESGKIDVLNYKDRPNLVATLKGSGGGKSLLINGHIDTVTVEPENLWTYPPFDAEEVEGHIYGRGASDMKGGMVASLCAIQALIGVGAPLKGDLLFSSVVKIYCFQVSSTRNMPETERWGWYARGSNRMLPS
jgi:acetylornithine deacetylase